MLALGASVWVIIAQDNGGQTDNPRPPRRQNADNQGGPGMRGHRPIPFVIQVLDANHDGVIDAEEIANAPAALRKLDKNGDGKLTMDELLPPPPQGMGGRPEGGQGQGNGPQGGPQRSDSGPGFDGPPGDQP